MDERLDHQSIQRQVLVRRATARSRSYAAMTTIGAVVGGWVCLIDAVGYLRMAYIERGAAFSLASVALFAVSFVAVRRLIDLSREMSRHLIDVPEPIPDFST